jgi:VIT1/CCC1 family predicted Fe2+/Mn2+ transporter
MSQSLLGEEADEIRNDPEGEQAELVQIYQDRGFEPGDALDLAKLVMKNPKLALAVMARDELGVDPAEMGGNPWRAAGMSFALFSLGAIVPLAPFGFAARNAAVMWSVGLSLLGLLGLGLATARFNGRSALYSGIRQVLIGAAVAAVTFGAGRLFGAEIR